MKQSQLLTMSTLFKEVWVFCSMTLFPVWLFQTESCICLYLFLIWLLETYRRVLKCVTKLFLLTNSYMNSAYARLLQSIQRIIYQEGFDGSDPQVLKTLVLFYNPVTNLFSEFSREAQEGLGQSNEEQAVSKHC